MHGRRFFYSPLCNVQKSVTQIIYLGPLPSDECSYPPFHCRISTCQMTYTLTNWAAQALWALPACYPNLHNWLSAASPCCQTVPVLHHHPGCRTLLPNNSVLAADSQLCKIFSSKLWDATMQVLVQPQALKYCCINLYAHTTLWCADSRVLCA